MRSDQLSREHHPWLERAEALGRTVLRACRQFDQLSTTASCAATPRIPRHR